MTQNIKSYRVIKIVHLFLKNKQFKESFSILTLDSDYCIGVI